LIDEFAFFVYALKNIKRSGWKNKLNLNNGESVADHTYAMTILGMTISDLQGLKTEKIMRMSLLHDLAESITGDIMPDVISKNEKNSKENIAILKILNELPNQLAKKYFMIWEEFQKNESIEAKFVHELDKLEMAIQAKLYQKHGINEKEIKPFLESAMNGIVSDEMNKILKIFLN